MNYIIWSAYLLADWVAAFTVGLIASNLWAPWVLTQAL